MTDALWQVTRLYVVGDKLFEAAQSFGVDSKACFRIGNEVSEWFFVNIKVCLGCVMSPWLFNLCKDRVVRKLQARILGRGT